jgi:hypothetical protein
MGGAVDDSSELLGLNYKNTKCAAQEYAPHKYKPTGPASGCIVRPGASARQCLAPREDTRLSNPPSTLRGTGINRWEWLCFEPQDTALEEFDRVPVNYRMVAKDNHVPYFEKPLEITNQIASKPWNSEDDLKKWQTGNARHRYSPGYPEGYINYDVRCR